MMNQGWLAVLSIPVCIALAAPPALAGEAAAQGLSTERMARIAPVMKEEIAKGTFPGAVSLIARNGEIVHLEAHGFLDAAKTVPMTKDAVLPQLLDDQALHLGRGHGAGRAG